MPKSPTTETLIGLPPTSKSIGTPIKDGIPHGTLKFFEYHCWEDEKSSDCHLWLRSHQQVIVLECTNPEFGDIPLAERCETATSLIYRIRFSDGFEGDAWEDELLNSEESYQRPDPPKLKDTH